MPQTNKKKIVVVGGGTGTHTLLKGLKRYADKFDISAIVTMADSGGSTGRLRDEFGQLPVGDVRMALAALAADFDSHDELVRELFLYRFSKGEGLNGHNFGNLLLTALTDILGSEVLAIEAASRILRVRGRVIPVTIDSIHLKAVFDDGEVVVGEHAIDEPPAAKHKRRIVDLSVTPNATLNPAAAEALSKADLIVLGPGDFYTSILANCVVGNFADVFTQSKAIKVYVGNLMSRSGQTINMHTAEYIAELVRYLGSAPDHMLINNSPLVADLLVRYRAEGNHPVEQNCIDGVCTIHSSDFLATEAITSVSGDKLKRSLIRHDSDKLASAIIGLL